MIDVLIEKIADMLMTYGMKAWPGIVREQGTAVQGIIRAIKENPAVSSLSRYGPPLGAATHRVHPLAIRSG